MTERGNFTPVFEQTETEIKQRMVGRIEADGWRAEPGDFPHDAVAPSAPEIKELQRNQDYILSSRFARYAEGPDLDESLYEVGLERIPASPNKRQLDITADAGVTIPAGHTLYALITDDQGEPLTYTVDAGVNFAAAGTQTLNITAVTPGTVGNLEAGSEFIFQPTIPGVRTIADTGSSVLGRDVETDADAWARYDFKVNHPDTGGNKNDYVRWAMEVGGVGKAKTIPRHAGVNTVKVIVVGNDFTPASAPVVADVQTYLDPGAQGLGEGKAPMGAATTAAAAQNLAVNIAVTGLQLTAGATAAGVLVAFQASVRDYLASLVFEVDANKNPLPVVYNRILGLLTFTPGVSNFTDVTVNGGKADLAVGAEQAPTLGSVTGI